MSVVRGQSSIRVLHFGSPHLSSLTVQVYEPEENSEERRMRLIGSNSLWGNQRCVRSVGCTYMQILTHTHTHMQRLKEREGKVMEGGQERKKEQLARVQTPDTA